MRVRRGALRAGAVASVGLVACGCSAAYAPTLAPPTAASTTAPPVASPAVISVTAVRPRIPLRAAPIAPTEPAPSQPAPTEATGSAEPPSSAAPEPAAPPTTPTPAGRAFTIVVAGDLLAHTSVIDQARGYAADRGYDFSPMLRSVQPIVAAADLAICHLETPVAPPGTPADGSYPDYGVPAEITAAIASAGFDRCSLASNHSMDKGAAGIDATLNAFDAAGLGHAGMARTPAEAGPALFTVAGITVAHLSYTFSFNGRRLPKDQPWRSNLIDPARIVAEARQARQAGARFVILSLHWGSEGSSTVTSGQRRWAEEITASGAVDVIVGHHAHVVQPIEQVNGRWVVFGLGNFLTGMGQSSPCCGVRGQDGMMVRLRVTEQPDGSFVVATPEAIAIYVDRRGYVVLPVQLGLDDAASSGTASTRALTDSLGRTGAVVGGYLVPS